MKYIIIPIIFVVNILLLLIIVFISIIFLIIWDFKYPSIIPYPKVFNKIFDYCTKECKFLDI